MALSMSSFFLLATVLSVLLLRSNADSRGVLGVCIQNCGQCKKMYGDFFMGQHCAEECLQTFGFSTPDCNKASSIQRFLGFSQRRIHFNDRNSYKELEASRTQQRGHLHSKLLFGLHTFPFANLDGEPN